MIEVRLTRVASGYTGIYPAAKGSSAEEPEGLCLNPKASGAAENIRCTVTKELSMTGPGLVESCQAYGKEEIFLFCEVMTVMISHSRRFFSFCMERIER